MSDRAVYLVVMAAALQALYIRNVTMYFHSSPGHIKTLHNSENYRSESSSASDNVKDSY